MSKEIPVAVCLVVSLSEQRGKVMNNLNSNWGTTVENLGMYRQVVRTGWLKNTLLFVKSNQTVPI